MRHSLFLVVETSAGIIPEPEETLNDRADCSSINWPENRPGSEEPVFAKKNGRETMAILVRNLLNFRDSQSGEIYVYTPNPGIRLPVTSSEAFLAPASQGLAKEAGSSLFTAG